MNDCVSVGLCGNTLAHTMPRREGERRLLSLIFNPPDPLNNAGARALAELYDRDQRVRTGTPAPMTDRAPEVLQTFQMKSLIFIQSFLL